MKIVHIITTLAYGGAEKICIDLCNEMSKKDGLEIFLISLFDPTGEQRPLSSLHEKVTFFSAGKKTGMDLGVINKVYQILKKINPDVINTHLTGLFYSIRYIIARHRKVKVFHTLHNPATKDVHGFFLPFHAYLIRKKWVTPIALSEEIKSTALSYFKIYDCPCIFNGISVPKATNQFEKVRNEINAYKKNEDTKVFLNLARIHPQKNQEMLIKLFAELKSMNIILLIIGTCVPAHADLLEQLKQLATSNIFILGKKDNPQDYLYCADAFCLSSLYEGLPLSLLEALAMRKVAISTPVGGIPSVIKDRQNGLLSKSIDRKDYENVILQFLSSSTEEITNLKENGFRTFEERFTLQACVNTYLSLYSNPF